MLLGAIADDYTGASDLASMLSEKGVRTALLFGVEAFAGAVDLPHQAVVVALKSRSIPAEEACSQSLHALLELRRLGARQIYFKYCSTFDSSSEGNIGPVTEELMKALGIGFTVAVPALPVNGRTQYLGHLFVGDRLLSESHMRHHPIHPMTESNLVRHLQAQTRVHVGLIPHSTVRRGAVAIRDEIRRMDRSEDTIALVDAVTDDDLVAVAEAVEDHPLVTGGSGLGMALPGVWRRHGMLDVPEQSFVHASKPGPVLILSGSCSAATLDQIGALERSRGPGISMDVLRVIENPEAEVDRLMDAASDSLLKRGWALVYSSAAPGERERLIGAAGGGDLSGAIERVHAALARRAVGDGLVRHLIVAGGETSGAVMNAVGLRALEVAHVLDPGVPVMRSLSDDLTVTLKSGNFGSSDFFSKALTYLRGS